MKYDTQQKRIRANYLSLDDAPDNNGTTLLLTTDEAAPLIINTVTISKGVTLRNVRAMLKLKKFKNAFQLTSGAWLIPASDIDAYNTKIINRFIKLARELHISI